MNTKPQYTTYLWRGLLTALVVVAFIGINVFVLSRPDLVESLEQIGLVGLFFLSVLSGFNVVVPIPVSALFPSFAALGYTSTLIISIIAVGMTIGDTLGFFVGKSAQGVVLHARSTARVSAYATKHPRLIIVGVFFYAMMMPLPNELIVMPLASLRVPWYQILIPVFFGNIIFTTIISFGAVGLTSLFL